MHIDHLTEPQSPSKRAPESARRRWIEEPPEWLKLIVRVVGIVIGGLRLAVSLISKS